MVKAETQNHKGFTIIYSHSLFLTGIVQMIATLGMMTLTQSNKEQSYGNLLKIFGIVLIMAALPVLMIIAYRISSERKNFRVQPNTNDTVSNVCTAVKLKKVLFWESLTEFASKCHNKFQKCWF